MHHDLIGIPSYLKSYRRSEIVSKNLPRLAAESLRER